MYVVPATSDCSNVPLITPVDVSRVTPEGNAGLIDTELGHSPVNIGNTEFSTPSSQIRLS